MATKRSPDRAGACAISAEHALATRRWWALGALSLGLYMTLVSVHMVAIARPTIQLELDLTLSQLQWVGSAYTMAIAILMLAGGRFADTLGSKRVYMAGLAIFIAGSILSSGARGEGLFAGEGYAILLAGRLVQGAGGAILLPAGLSILSSTFPEPGRNRGKAFGAYGSVTGLGTASAPLLGGLLIQFGGWQSIFLVAVPLGLAALALASWSIDEPPKAAVQGKFDKAGFLTSAIGLSLLMTGFIQASETSAPQFAATAAVGAAMLLLFAFVELRTDGPMVELRLFRNRNFAAPVLVAFCINATEAAIFFFLILYLQNTLSMQPLTIGELLIPFNLTIFLAALLSGRILPLLGARATIAIALGVLAAGVALVMGGVSATTTGADLLPGLFAMGFGIGLANPPVSSTATGSVGKDHAGMASGLTVFARQIGYAFGVAALSLALSAVYPAKLATRLEPLSQTVGAEAAAQLQAQAAAAGPIEGSFGRIPSAAERADLAAVGPQISSAARNAFIDSIRVLFGIGLAIVIFAVCVALTIDRHFGRSGRQAPRTAEAGSESP